MLRRPDNGWQSSDGCFRERARGPTRSFHAAPRIDVAAHRIEVVDAAAQRALERRLTPEGQIAVWAGKPAHRTGVIGEQQLQALVDAEHERDALELVARQRADLPPLPIVIGRARDIAEQRTPLID